MWLLYWTYQSISVCGICMLKGASWTSYWEASWELFLNLGTPQCATKSKFLCPFTQKTAAINKVYCSKITLSTFCCHNKIQSAGSVLHHCHPSCHMWPSHGSPSVTSCVSPEVLKCWSRNKENKANPERQCERCLWGLKTSQHESVIGLMFALCTV